MISPVVKFFTFLLLLYGATAIYAQPADPIPDATTRSPRRSRIDRPFGLDEMLAKQRVARDKKNHEEMLERGEEALRLANQLEASFSQNKNLSTQDKAKLQSLEKVVTKIREDLGGDDDESEELQGARAEEPKPSNVEEAFRYLQSTTIKLVDELKRTTRYSISAIAIQSSNTVLKIVKFLRLRK